MSSLFRFFYVICKFIGAKMPPFVDFLQHVWYTDNNKQHERSNPYAFY